MPTQEADKTQQSTEPNLLELQNDYARSFNDERVSNRIKNSDDTRFAIWKGQSEDGKKHSDLIGGKAFPWEQASDTRIRLADELCNFMVNMSTSAVDRAALNIKGIEQSDSENAGLINLYLQWVLTVLLHPDWEEELELHADYVEQYGWSVLHVTWERCYAQVPREINLKTLTGYLSIEDPQQFEALAAALQTNQDMLADMLSASNPGLPRKKILKHIKEIAETGKTTFEVPEMVVDRPCITALRPYHEVLFPPETTDFQRARCIFRRDYYTVAELEEKAANGEWKKDFVEEAKKTVGQSSQVYDTPRSPISGNPQGVEERSNLIEVIHAFSRRVTENGNPGIYETVFCPSVTHDNQGSELYGEHKLVTEAGDTYPFVEFTREKTRRSPIESRGIPEIVKTWQNEYKAQADMTLDRSSIDTMPPLRVPLRYGQRIKIGPGVQLKEQRPNDISWMEPPRRGAELAFELMNQITLRADRYFGRPNADIPAVETQMLQQAFVKRWLRHMSTVVQRIWGLVQKFDSDERFMAVTGTEKPLPRDPGKFNFSLNFDVRELDNEFVEKKLQAISNFVLPEDALGIVDRTKLIRKKLQVIDPTLANELVTENAEASQKMFDEVNAQVISMALGNQPKYVENDPSASIKMQFLQQIIGNNPKYQQLLQTDQQFQELIQNYVQNLNMSVMQQQNKQVGRLGVNPNA